MRHYIANVSDVVIDLDDATNVGSRMQEAMQELIFKKLSLSAPVSVYLLYFRPNAGPLIQS